MLLSQPGNQPLLEVGTEQPVAVSLKAWFSLSEIGATPTHFTDGITKAHGGGE